MATSYTREAKGTTSFTKEPKPGISAVAYYTWDSATMSWDDATFTWDDSFTIVPATPYTRESKPTTSFTKRTGVTATYTRKSPVAAGYTKETKP